MTVFHHPKPADVMDAVGTFAGAIVDYHPRAIILFGSALPFLENPDSNPAPNDIDLLVVGDLLPVVMTPPAPPVPIEIHRIRLDDITAIATSLRYDPKPVCISRLYGGAVLARHSIRIIVASMLLGPDYNAFGIEQIDIDGRLDTRDYSRHRVIHGAEWWRRLTRWANNRRGPLKRLSDRIVLADRFVP